LCEEKQFVDIVKDVNAINVAKLVIVNARHVVILIINMIDVVNVIKTYT
jgi:hypothetical protein